MLKVTLKGISLLILIVVLLYGGFHLWEYCTGSKYIAYLKENSETVPLDKTFTFDQLDVDIENSKLVLVGEIHGFEEPQKFDYELFTHLNSNHNVNQYYAELDFVQAIYLNRYLENGDEELLKAALRKWGVYQGRRNKDYYEKFYKFQKYYTELDEASKFIFLGVDKIQDLGLTSKYLSSLVNSAADTII